MGVAIIILFQSINAIHDVIQHGAFVRLTFALTPVQFQYDVIGC